VIHLDTTFIVDLQREAAKGRGPATAFLEERASEQLCLSVHALCELQAGARLARHPARERTRLDTLVASMNVAYPNEKFVEIFADTFAALERRGARAPAMDLLIAVTALADRAPLVTRNRQDFETIPGLEVLAY
jgi:predicted nucleic acid-binding protein